MSTSTGLIDYVQGWTDICEQMTPATESALYAAIREANRLAYDDGRDEDESMDPTWCEDAVKAYRNSALTGATSTPITDSDLTVLTDAELIAEIDGLTRRASAHGIPAAELAYLGACEEELYRRSVIVISGSEARELVGWVVTYVRPGTGWSEVQVMRECGHGCKLHVRRDGRGEFVFALLHYAGYGCALGREESTRLVPVEVVQLTAV